MMKNTRIIAPAVLGAILLITANCANAPPGWNIPSDAPSGVLYGQGEGGTREKAKAEAFKSLAEQLQLQIISDLHLYEQEDGQGSTMSLEYRVETHTNIVLHGAKILREEQKAGRWYLLCRYDSRPLRMRVQEKLVSAKGPASSSMQHSTLKTLPFARFLEENGLPSLFYLDYDKNLWRVSLGNHSLPLTSPDLATEFFFPR